MSQDARATVLGNALVPDGDVVAELRRLMPPRTLTWAEAHSVAERQAALLLDFWQVSEPPVPQFVISSLPGIHVDWQRNWPTSGMALRAHRHWRIVVNRGDVRQRQRFSLAHEFKHVLDDPVVTRTDAYLKPHRREERAERLCNYFAACLYMPRPWVKHDYCGGMQSVRALARRYFVSEEAMTTRLSELGLTPMTLAVEVRSRHRSAA